MSRGRAEGGRQSLADVGSNAQQVINGRQRRGGGGVGGSRVGRHGRGGRGGGEGGRGGRLAEGGTTEPRPMMATAEPPVSHGNATRLLSIDVTDADGPLRGAQAGRPEAETRAPDSQ